MPETIITVNPTNWITITLMAFGGFVILGVIAKVIAQQKGGA